MRIGVIRDGQFMTADEAEAYGPPRLRADYPTPQLSSDYPPYRSPLEGHRIIDGRRERREEMKRNNCRPMEAGEGIRKDGFWNRSFAEKRGLPWTPPPARKQDFEPAPFERAKPDKRRLAPRG